MLHVIMYHYVRDLPRTRFPKIKGMLLSDFEKQVDDLSSRFEMASAASALGFLQGDYKPARDLCLLTFDDGLKEHFSEVTPILAQRGIQGVFSLITSCIEDKQVAPVHMNHFLTAGLEFEEYRAAFLASLEERAPGKFDFSEVDSSVATRTYRWDTGEMARFKYFFNFVLPGGLRDSIIAELFEQHLGDESKFAEELYVSWPEARQMQDAGMALSGHSHTHRPLSKLTGEELEKDLGNCRRLMDANVGPQSVWPFCYPYGKRDSFSEQSVELLRRLGYDCAYSTEPGPNGPGAELFEIHRVDCKQAP